MKRLVAAAILAALAALALAAGEKQFQVVTDCSRAPEMREYAVRAKALCEEWYPKINDLLFGSGHSLPLREIRITIDPAESERSENARGAGLAHGHRLERRNPHVREVAGGQSP